MKRPTLSLQIFLILLIPPAASLPSTLLLVHHPHPAALITLSALIAILIAALVSRLAARHLMGRFTRSISRIGRRFRDTAAAFRTRQEELLSILEGMTAPVLLLDKALEIRELNPAAAAMVGRTADNCRGRGMLSVFRSPELYDLGRRVIDNETSADALIRIDRNGAQVFLQTNASLIRAGCLMVMNDITQITRMEMMRKEFAANVSHELRTPITSILGFVETMQNSGELPPHRRADFLEIVRRQAVRLKEIISDLMSLSLLEEGDVTASLETVAVRHIFKGAVDILTFKAESKGVSIRISAPRNLKIPVFPLLAEQALVNLLDNAVKYSDQGGTVHLSAQPSRDEIVLSVTDEGTGIPEAELDRIFQRFHRVDKARSRELGGTGLGLAIVKHIALKHGGRAWAESRLGHGCRFSIAFPLPRSCR